MNKCSIARCMLLLTLFMLTELTLANVKKPPFNGSIFGKRGNYGGELRDYDSAGRTLSVMCEIASEACSGWFPQADKR